MRKRGRRRKQRERERLFLCQYFATLKMLLHFLQKHQQLQQIYLSLLCYYSDCSTCDTKFPAQYKTRSFCTSGSLNFTLYSKQNPIFLSCQNNTFSVIIFLSKDCIDVTGSHHYTFHSPECLGLCKLMLMSEIHSIAPQASLKVSQFQYSME